MDAADEDVLRVRNLTSESLLSSLFHLLKSDATALGANPFAPFVKGALHLLHGRFTAGALHDINWQEHKGSCPTNTYPRRCKNSVRRNSIRPMKVDMRDMTVYPNVAPKNIIKK